MTAKNKKFIQKFRYDYENIIRELYEKKLIRDIREHNIKENSFIEISRNNKCQESKILYDKHLPIDIVMNTLLEKKEYNILLYDRAIIQYEFIIKEGKIIKERLIFIKKHNYLWPKEEIAGKDMDNFGDDWYVQELGIPVVIRIDYDIANHEDIKHPITHMTLSNYDECRIPMLGSVSLYNFINFILNFFYDDKLDFKSKFEEKDITITENERKRIHLEW